MDTIIRHNIKYI